MKYIRDLNKQDLSKLKIKGGNLSGRKKVLDVVIQKKYKRKYFSKDDLKELNKTAGDEGVELRISWK